IVSDDGNRSTSQQMILTTYAWVRWIQGPRRGPAANRNFGAKLASGQWLVFIDDDCLPDSNLLNAYSNAISLTENTKVFEGRTYVDRPKTRHDEVSPTNEAGGYLWSCNFCIQKVFFDSLNGFDETYPYPAMEDVDLHYRLTKNGHQILFVKEA